MATNIATYCLSSATVTIRDAENATAGQDWAGGLNLGGSNAPGVGLNTGTPEPKLTDWTLLDQAGAARTPQNSQHLGGNGLGPGSETAIVNLRAIQDADINDTLSFVSAAQQTAPGAGLGPAGADPLNRTGFTVESGQNCWGTNTVA